MSWKAHKTKTHRKLITITEWAELLKITRQKVNTQLDKYRKKGENYDPTDIYSVLTFYRYLILSSLY